MTNIRIGVVVLAACAGGCAALPPARMVLPDELAAQAPVPLQGLTPGRRGEFEIAGQRGRFERSASRLSLFDDALAVDRVGAGYTLQAGAAGQVDSSCRGRQTGASVGVLAGAPRPYEVQCDFSGAFSGRLTLAASTAALGTRAERSGRIASGDDTLELRSVHRVPGSPLPLATPIGYLFVHQGRPIGAVEINGSTPRLWRPPPGAPMHDAVTQGAIALALLWDPADH